MSMYHLIIGSTAQLKKQFLETCNLFIMTPKGIEHIDPAERKNCTIIYLDISGQYTTS